MKEADSIVIPKLINSRKQIGLSRRQQTQTRYRTIRRRSKACHATTNATIVKARKRGQHTSVLPLDITQFFPYLTSCNDHNTTFQQEFIVNFFSDPGRNHSVGTDGAQTFPPSTQGDCLSPILSALYLSILLTLAFQWGTDNKVNL